MTALQERLAESERARQLQANQLADMQAAQQRQQQEIEPQKQRFLDKHPEARQQMDRLAKLHRSALVAGLPDNSDEYFSYLERALSEPPATSIDEGPAPSIEPELEIPAPKPKPQPLPPEPERSFTVSAPPHRESYSMDTGRPESYSSKVELSKEQVEHAKLAGVSQEDYARGVLRLEREKRSGVRQA